MRSALGSLWLVIPTIAAVGCGGGGGQVSATGMLCNEMVDCGAIPGMLSQVCQQRMGVYVADPAAARACVASTRLTCDTVTDETALHELQAACLYDPATFACDATNTILTVCSPATAGFPSVCKELDCRSVCKETVGSSGSCGLDEDDARDECICTG